MSYDKNSRFRFNKHYDLAGTHATFSPSQYSFIHYSDEKLIETYKNKIAADKGTRMHAWAAEAIDMNINPRSRDTLINYIVDALGYRMQPEVPLYFSKHFYGTADAISFKKGVLRIHDLKTGKIPAKITQLELYAALFCLEYHINPKDIQIILKIYQAGNMLEEEAEADDILSIMETFQRFEKLISEIDEDK